MTDDDVIRIPLRARDGSVRAWAIVDREDADLAELRWSLCNTGYARRTLHRSAPPGQRVLAMHRAILERAVGRALSFSEQCDHANADKLDNRRANLRVAISGQNQANKKAWGSSVYLGVGLDRGKWRARIRPSGGHAEIWLGYFTTESEAARAYDRAAREYHGEFARLNFPDGDA